MGKSQGIKRIVALSTLMCALMGVATLSNKTSASQLESQPLMTIAVANNSSRDIYHLYLSPVDCDAWGPDLLAEGTLLRVGETFTISDAACAGHEIKVIAEDRQGCFVYTIVGCAQAANGWTITDATQPDCGN